MKNCYLLLNNDYICNINQLKSIKWIIKKTYKNFILL